MYDDALLVGIRPAEFWELSYGEIAAAIRAFNRREERRAKERRADFAYQSSIAYRQSALIAKMVLEPKKAPKLEEVFPECRAEGEEAQEPAEHLWRRQQAGMAAYVAAFNAARRRKERGNAHARSDGRD